MARQLNKKQLEILDKYVGKYKSAQDLPINIYYDIIRLNDFETIYQEINNYLYYKNFERATKNV